MKNEISNMKKLLILLITSCFLQIINAQIDPILSSNLQDILDNSVSNQGNRGVSAFLIMPDGKIWTGMAGVGKQNIPISENTLFHGASTTKFNIATLMLILEEEKFIDLDETWTKYISLDVGFDPSITIRQLLNHTSGIADYLETASSGNDIISDFNLFYTPQYILENVVSDIPDFAPGTNFQYSNSNYALASLIIEHVTGNPIHQELRNRIWNPLEMNHTYFGGYESYAESTAGVWWNFGNGLTDYSNQPTTSMLSYAYGAGNIVTCPTDLGKLLNAILDGQLISSENLEQMLTFVPNSFSSWTAGYGLGIHHASGDADDVLLGHDGYYTNLTDMFHSMKYGFTLVTMTNTQTNWFGIFNPMYDVVSNHILTTDVTDLKIKYEVSIYPNPTQKSINIESPEIMDEVRIIDALGTLYYHSKPNKKSISLSIESEGLYFIIAKSEEKIHTQKLIVKY